MKTCPVCNDSISPVFLCSIPGYSLCRCPACEVVYSDPMKNPGPEWYETSSMYAVGKALHTDVSWHHRQFLEDKSFYGPTLLDVGCGTGVFLSRARDKGYDVWGIDFDREEIRIAKEKYKLRNVFPLSVAGLSMEFKDRKFDIITFFEVLEHLDRPIEFMEEVRGILKPGGHIVLSLPNRDRALDTLGNGDFPPNHLSRWNRQCLEAFLRRNGFDAVRCVVKRVDAEEVAGYLKARLRLGIAHRLAMKGIEENKIKNISLAAALMRGKDVMFRAATLPLMPVMAALKLQGTGLFVLAKARK